MIVLPFDEFSAITLKNLSKLDIDNDLREYLIRRILADKDPQLQQIFKTRSIRAQRLLARCMADQMFGFLMLRRGRDEEYMPSWLVLIAWHHFFLRSREYHLFCMNKLGYFVHFVLPGETQDVIPPSSTVAAMEAQGDISVIRALWDYER